MTEIQTIKKEGFTMRYFRFGSGKRTFVMLPGLSIKSVMESAQAVAEAYGTFEKEYTVYCLDRREELKPDCTIADLARDTVSALEMLDLRDIDLFGASQGGMIAQCVALLAPERMRTLLLGSTTCAVSPEAEEGLHQWIDAAEEGNGEALCDGFARLVYPAVVYEASKDLLKGMAASVNEEDLARFRILAAAAKGFDLSEEVKKIECPVLILGARDDAVLGEDAAQKLVAAFKDNANCEVKIYEGYGHAAYDLAPDYKDTLLSFLARH